MKKTTPLFVIGTILLFIGLSVSPVLAGPENTETIAFSYINEDQILSTQTLTLSQTELQEFNQLMSNVMEKIKSATDYATALSIVKDYIDGCCGSHSKLKNVFMLLMRNMFNAGTSHPSIRQNVMVLSSGFTNTPFSLRGTRINMHRAFTIWFYTLNSNLLVKSTTMIVDPYPFNVKTLTSRQFGMMRGFTGLYITQYSTTAHKDFTYFIGSAKNAMGYDLSI